jgi:hypothetical protein
VLFGDLVVMTRLRRGAVRVNAWDPVADDEVFALAEMAKSAFMAAGLLQDAVDRLGAAGDLLLPVERERMAWRLGTALEQVEQVQAFVEKLAGVTADPDAHIAWREAARAAAEAELGVEARRLDRFVPPGR